MKKILLIFACLAAALFGCSKAESALKDMSGGSYWNIYLQNPVPSGNTSHTTQKVMAI